MELSVGMYVRIKNEAGWCCIGKIHNINDFREPSMKYCVDIQSDDFVFIPEDMIAKASHNIIDLIEVGDYVNGIRIDELSHNRFTNAKAVSTNNSLRKDTGKQYWFENEHIKSIVTKEMFSSVEYRVETN